MAKLELSMSSAYRHVAALAESGLLTTVVSGRYVLGPAIIQYDRQIQLTDPLLRSAQQVMPDLLRYAPENALVVLCRRYRDTVLCVHQLAKGPALPGVSFERGRPMPVFLGSTAKIILAYVPARDLRRIYQDNTAAIKAANLGTSWEEFTASLAVIRKARHVIAFAEVDPDRLGIAAPLLDSGRRILGSITLVTSTAEFASASRLAAIMIDGAREIEENMTG